MPIRQMKKVSAKALGLHLENHRVHSKEHVRRLARSIRQFRPVAPPVIDENGVVLDGQARCLAAREFGLGRVPALPSASVQDGEGPSGFDDVPSMLLEATRQAAARKRPRRSASPWKF
jgi:hypothetical protein